VSLLRLDCMRARASGDDAHDSATRPA